MEPSNGVLQTSQLHFSPSSVKHSTFRILWTAGPEIQGDLDWVPLCFSRWLCILLFDPLWIHFVAQMSECNRIYFPALGPSRPWEKRSCDGQPLRWPPGFHALGIVPSYSGCDRQGEVIEHDSWGSGTKDTETSALLSLGEVRLHVVRMLKLSCGKAHVMKGSSLQPAARTDLPAMVRVLSFSPS